jgi:hypothetical protein
VKTNQIRFPGKVLAKLGSTYKPLFCSVLFEFSC